MSYERLPNILVLQLKRFCQSLGGAAEKVSHYMPTPLVLDCFCNECSPGTTAEGRPQHAYELYGVIMHLGASMASGHYVAYTRAPDQLDAAYQDCDRDSSVRVTSTTSELAKSMNFLKFFRPRGGGSSMGGTAEGSNSEGSVCRGRDCCGVRLAQAHIENALNGTSSRASAAAHLWLECDDDVVRTLSSDELESLLSCKKNSPATPYLLFYSRVKTSVAENTGTD